MGTGSNLSVLASSIVTAARNMITVMLSINIESSAAITMNVKNSGIGLYRTMRASAMHSQRKNPLSAMPSTITIMPAIKKMVSQLMPVEVSPPLSAANQNGVCTMLCTLSAFITAPMSCISRLNTTSSVSSAADSVTICRSTFSLMISPNIPIKITIAAICAPCTSIRPPISTVLFLRVLETQIGNSIAPPS